MKRTRRCLALLLALCLLFSLTEYTIPAKAASSDPEETGEAAANPPGENGESTPSGETSEPSPEPEISAESAGGDAPAVPEEAPPAVNYLDRIPYGELSGRNADDLLRVAASQLGYAESDLNVITDGSGEIQGYSEYGAWYGDDFIPWNAVFVLFCLDRAGYDGPPMPFDPEAGRWLALLQGQGLTTEPSQAQPKPGDLAFTRGPEGQVRVGVVRQLLLQGETASLELIEGDCAGSVAARVYEFRPDSAALLALLTLPSYPDSGEESAEIETGPDTLTLREVVAKLPLSKLTGEWADDLLTLARSQLGYAESRTNAITNEYGEPAGYTAYGEFYEIPYGEWCAMFLGFCLTYAGVSEYDFPFSALVCLWLEELKEEGLYRPAKDYVPVEGDIVFFGWREEDAAHVGVVTGVAERENAAATLFVIEGNADERVMEKLYRLDEPYILGYGTLSAAQKIRTVKAAVFADENRNPFREDAEVRITLTGALPRGTRAEAFPAQLTLENGQRVFSAWNIALHDTEGEPVRPVKGTVRVEITAPEAGKALATREELGIYRLREEELTVLPLPPVVTESGFSFEAEESGLYALGSVPYSGDYIPIASFDQLLKIGTDAVVTDSDGRPGKLGRGQPVPGRDGEALRYSSDAHYRLERDIVFPRGEIWQLPEDFTGNFAGPENADAKRLYDRASDSIYLQNPYQLAMLSAGDRSDSPVLTGDAATATFGEGQLIWPEGEGKGAALTYAGSHRYILSAAFHVDHGLLPRSLRRPEDNSERVEGRDYFGQATVDIGGTSYILLGDRQQLDAINASDADGGVRVCGPVFRVTQRRRYLVGWEADNLVEERVELIYPGDADLLPGVFNGSDLSDFSDRPLYASPDSGYPELTAELRTTGYERSFICTVDPDTGRWSMEQRSLGSLRYTKDGHYIVFRDIDMNVGALNGREWRPLRFSGTLLGVKAADPAEISTLWDKRKTAICPDAARKPVISHAAVVPAADPQGQERPEAPLGVGFFGAIESRWGFPEGEPIPALVQNLKLAQGSVLDPAAERSGAFAGCIRGRATVTDCLVEDFVVDGAAAAHSVDRLRVTGRGGVVGCVYAAGHAAPTVRNCGVSASAERFGCLFAGAVWVSDPWALPSLRRYGAFD